MPSAKRQPSSSHSTIPTKLRDNLHVLPVQFPETPSYPHTAAHYLYIRPDASEDTSRNLFVSNIPITASEASFRAFFKSLCGAVVSSVQFSRDVKKGQLGIVGEVVIKGTTVGIPVGRKRKRRSEVVEEQDEVVKGKLAEMEIPSTWGSRVWESGSSAVVQFVDEESRAIAWKAVKKGTVITWPTELEEMGLARYKTHHKLSHPDPTILQHSVNTYLSHFSTLESIRSKHLATQRNIPDADGFVTVTRGGRTGPARLEEAQAAAERLKARAEKRAGSDFYRFQSREARKKRESELRRKFEEDRRKVGEMRERKGGAVPEA